MAIHSIRLDMAAYDEKEAYESFYKKTEPEEIGKFATGESLTELVTQADTIQRMLFRYNPIFDRWNHRWGDQNKANHARKWEIIQLSDVKERLKKALDQKRSYYENHSFGKIIQFVLRLFCLWNGGNTASIIAAEDFLLRWNLDNPLQKVGSHYEKCEEKFLLNTSLDNYKQGLNIDHFYNYVSTRVLQIL